MLEANSNLEFVESSTKILLVAFISPTTCSFCEPGLVVPIPTLPSVK